MPSIEERYEEVRKETARTDAGRGALERLSPLGSMETPAEQEEHLKMLRWFMENKDEAGLAIYVAERERRAEARGAEMADTDHLTGIFNRRALERDVGRVLTKLQQRYDRAQMPETERRYTEPGLSEGLSFILVDLDHFKQLNDTYGHLAGDDALQAVAHALKQHLRPSDVVARWGGEEFVVVLTSYNTAARLAVAEKIRRTIEELQVTHDGTKLPVTASIGVAKWQPGETLTDLFEKADSALYRAKEGGRNRIVDAEDELA
jgi:diguanylate cyclase